MLFYTQDWTLAQTEKMANKVNFYKTADRAKVIVITLRVNYILYQLFYTNSAIFQALNKIQDFEAGLRQTTNQLNQKEEHLEDIFNKVKVQG